MNTATGYQISTYALTDKGLMRPINEDAYGIVEGRQFFALADGLGGRNAGEIASAETIKEVCHQIDIDSTFSNPSLSEKRVLQRLLEVISDANHKIWLMGQESSALQGMGTTLTCALFFKESLIAANVGDSRLYRLRGDQLEQLTKDDSLLSDLLQFGLIDESEAKIFPLKHVITKSIGGFEDIDTSFTITSIEAGDLYLLCSDGLHGLVSTDKISTLLKSQLSLKEKGDRLLKEALDNGGLDNITLILVQTLCKST